MSNPLIERKEADGERSEALVLAALAELIEGASTTAIAARTGLGDRTVRRVLGRLQSAGMATREGERGPWHATSAGRAQSAAGAPGLDLAPAVTAAVDMLPTEAHKAFVRLALSAVPARWHLLGRYPDGWSGFVVLGPTQTGKTTAAHFVREVFGLPRERAVRLLQSETPASLIGARTTEQGGRRSFEPSALLAEPFLCLDEFDKARANDLRAAALRLLQGDAVAEWEGETVELRPTTMVTLNARPSQLAGLVGDAYLRRSVVLDTTPLQPLLGDIASVVRRLRRPGVIPRVDLERLRPPAAELPEELWEWLDRWLRHELTQEGRSLVDVEALSRLALGRACWTGGDLATATMATAFDYLTTATTLDHVQPGYAQRLLGHLGGADRLLPDAAAAVAEGERRALVVRDGRRRDLDEQLRLTARHEAFKAQVEEARAPLLRHKEPQVRAVAQALKRVLDELANRTTESGLAEVETSAAPWIIRAEEWKAERDTERLRAQQEVERVRRELDQQRQLERQLRADGKRLAAQTKTFERRQAQVRKTRQSALQRLYNRTTTRDDDVLALLIDHEVIALRERTYTYEVGPNRVANWLRRNNIIGGPEEGPRQEIGRERWYEDRRGGRYAGVDLAEFGTPTVSAAIEAAAAVEGLILTAPPRRKPRARPATKPATSRPVAARPPLKALPPG